MPLPDDLQHHCHTLEARSLRLLGELTNWPPADKSDPKLLNYIQAEQRRLLWDMAITAGGILLHLAVHRRLDALPRFQTRALQARADLRRYIDAGELPRGGPHGHGFDAMVVHLFDDCCRLWFPSAGPPARWFDNEAETARFYARFMNELAQRLRIVHPQRDNPAGR